MDDRAAFERKTRAMFKQYRAFVAELSFRYIVEIAEYLVEYTPGFENQNPEDTHYVPTGRLRGGFHYAAQRLDTASKWKDGPFSDYGVETVAKLDADMRAAGAFRSFWIVNDVAYGYIVLRGLGNHESPRNFVGDAAAITTQKVAFRTVLGKMRGWR